MKWIGIGVVVSLSAAVWPCCGVSIDGKGVVFGGQANVIIWDADTKTQHFIRQASFETEAPDLGFIAPTPSVPELEIADVALYRALEDLAPKPSGCAAQGLPTESAAASAGGVEVVQVKDVGAYRATTLRADDAKALAKWMTENGYVTTPSVEKWTEFYIGKKWYLTAFKIRADADLKQARTEAIRMTFKTDQPYNPYFVPKDNISDDIRAGLVIHFVSKGTYTNRVPSTDRTLKSKWKSRLDDDSLAAMRKALKHDLPGVSAGWEVARYEDWSFPSEVSDDLYFTYAGASTWAWTPARIAIDVAFVAVVIGGVVWWRRRRA